MKAFCGDDGKIRLFRPIENFNRMNNSAERICLPTFDNEEMRQCLHRYVELEKDWVPQGRGCSLYLRPTMIGTEVSLPDKNCICWVLPLLLAMVQILMLLCFLYKVIFIKKM